MRNSLLGKSYKDYVREAKLRMINNNYSDATKASVNIGCKSYFVNSRIVTGDELYNYYTKVVEVVETEQFANGIGALIDEGVFELLNPSEKERYVFDISRLYRDMKEEYLQKKVK